MRVQWLLPWLALLVLAACAPTSEGRYSLTVITHGQHSLASGETWAGDVYLLGGELAVPAGARVDGGVSILGGGVRVDGRVEGDMVLLDGAVRLGQTAQVGGSLKQGGGTLGRDPLATVQGGVTTGGALRVPQASGLFGGSWAGQVANGLAQALLVAGVAYALARVVPAPLTRVTEAVTGYPIIAGAVGLLTGVVALVLLVLLAFTIVLIPLALVGGFALLLAVVYGWAAWGVVIGRWLARRAGRDLTPALAGVGALLLMLVSALLRPAPLLGDIVPLVTTAGGLGAVIVTRFGLRAFVPASEVEAAEFNLPATEA